MTSNSELQCSRGTTISRQMLKLGSSCEVHDHSQLINLLHLCIASTLSFYAMPVDANITVYCCCTITVTSLSGLQALVDG
jgi:hypothetical protein